MSEQNTEALSTNRMLKELKASIFLQEAYVSAPMHHFFGNKPKYIIFISICDGKSRASVCKGIGNSLETSWKSAEDAAFKIIKNKGLKPIWIKADLVDNIKTLIYQDFLNYITGIKINYFREGLAFDEMFNLAFLEQEVNANTFIVENKDSQSKHLVWKNINFYIKNNLGLRYQIEESQVEKMYTFTTIGFFHDGETLHKLNNQWLNNGRRRIEIIDKDLIHSIIQKSSTYLTGQVDSVGKFRYGYFPCFNKEVEKYNILRHASTTYSMIEAYEITQDKELALAIKRALNYLVTDAIELTANPDGTISAFMVEKAQDNEIKLGANAAAILAFSKYTKVFGDDKYIELMEKLAEGITHFENKEDGSFVHVLNFPDLSVKERYRIIYYDGEAAFALMRLYEINRDERLVNRVEQVFKYFFQKQYWHHHDHWLSYCSNELFKYKPDKKYVEFNLANAGGILDFCLTRETTYPTLLELCMATFNMITRLRQENLYLETLASFDEEKLRRAIEHRVEHQLNGLYFPEVAMYYKVPQNILWAFYIRHHSFRSRIDDIEHNISGYSSYYHAIASRM